MFVIIICLYIRWYQKKLCQFDKVLQLFLLREDRLQLCFFLFLFVNSEFKEFWSESISFNKVELIILIFFCFCGGYFESYEVFVEFVLLFINCLLFFVGF